MYQAQAFVSCSERDFRRQTAPSALSTNGDPIGVYPKEGRVGDDMAEGSKAVVKWSREGCLWR